ncbi:hypothetical protein IAI10_10730 [Clostridium sp. 19966]|uniref:hypothetical protein n=1 Tax=Clostridium sp. 19966 TaxID=2768166 RepID=UPI0028DDDD2E|nr:hypothetical protein [Clostridium sp. 19966]MDT8717132.1 hypothetical protein [Clostridium sp. 19966]
MEELPVTWVLLESELQTLLEENNWSIIFQYKKSINENSINLIYRDGDGNGSKSFSSRR